jgi:hypothetical protein
MATIRISCANGTQRERTVRDELNAFLDRYDLSPYTFTDEVIINEDATPHSHPVLTLDAFNRGPFLLASYIHEQLHWYAEANEEAAHACIEWVKTNYPDAPIGLPDGAADEFSTYLHLVVNWLEVGVLRETLGRDPADQLATRLAETGVYRWIYRTVLNDYDGLTREYGARGLLLPQPLGP